MSKTQNTARGVMYVCRNKRDKGGRTTNRADNNVVEREPNKGRPLIRYGIKHKERNTWVAGIKVPHWTRSGTKSMILNLNDLNVGKYLE